MVTSENVCGENQRGVVLFCFVESAAAVVVVKGGRSSEGCRRPRQQQQQLQSRRGVMEHVGLVALGVGLQVVGMDGIVPAPAMAAGKKGFEPVKDQQDGYQFVYPFGWQEVTVSGQDVVYKDVIEPLESVSVSMIPTEKKSIEEYGGVKEVSYTLVRKVLTGSNQEVKLINSEVRETDGRKYYDFEFTASTPRYTRHACVSVTVGNGKFYTLETGANERRWKKMEDKAKTIVKSFEVFDRTDY